MNKVDPKPFVIDFRSAKSLEDLSHHIGTSVERITALVNSPSRQEFYRRRLIPKRSPRRAGEYREVWESLPDIALMHKTLLRRLNDFFSKYIVAFPADCVQGYVTGRGILSNARKHLAARRLLRADIENFFPSIPRQRIEASFTRLGLHPLISNALATIATINDVLALGINTSPLIANWICLDLDRKCIDLAAQHNAVYTRYADDLAFSSNDSLPTRAELAAIVEGEGFVLSKRKFRFTKPGQAHFVTGLCISDPHQPRVSKIFKRNLRQELYYCEKYGIQEHVGRRYDSYARGINVIDGSITFLQGIEPHLGAHFRHKWDSCLQRSPIRRVYSPDHRKGSNLVTLLIDETEMIFSATPVMAIGCAIIEDELTSFRPSITDLVDRYSADPFTSGRKKQLLNKGLHFTDDSEELKTVFISRLEHFPLRAYIAYGRAMPNEDYPTHYLRLVGSLLKDRFIAYDRRRMTIVCEENTRVDKSRLKNYVKTMHDELIRTNTCRPFQLNPVMSITKSEEPCLAVVDYILGVFRHYAMDLEGENSNRQDALRFERLRDKYRLIRDLDGNLFYSRQKPFMGRQ